MSDSRAAITDRRDWDDEILDWSVATRPAAVPGPGGRQTRIMLAEDDGEMRTLLADSLRREGYDVIATQNGLEMIEEIRMLLFRGDPLPVDLIVSDERMPGMPGLEFLSILREVEWPTPFILITGFGDEQTHERALEMGASVVLDKPFEIDDLHRAIQDVLQGRKPAPAMGIPPRKGSARPGTGSAED